MSPIPEKASDGSAPLQWQIILPASGNDRISSQAGRIILSGVVRKSRLLAATSSAGFAKTLESVKAAALEADSFTVSKYPVTEMPDSFKYFPIEQPTRPAPINPIFVMIAPFPKSWESSKNL